MFDINLEHPEYAARKAAYQKYRDMYVGGEQFASRASEYLIRRQKEPGDVYGERLSRVFYENYIGSIIDWYAATLFRREPVLTFEGSNESARRFYGTLVEDVDRKGTSLSDFFRQQFIEALVAGTSYVLVDFPRMDRRAATRGEEDVTGASRAYMVQYGPEDVINWSRDDQGNFEWVVIRTETVRKERIEDPQWQTETRWTYFDKESYRVYRRTAGDPSGPGLEDEGVHGLARLGMVPLFALEIPRGLWMMNRGASLQLEHFNKSNALSWALTMGLFAMPVVYSEREWTQMVGESYYIQLGPEDRFGWTEPEGKVYQIAADNLSRLKEEIYRVCYLTQAGGSSHSNLQQSGLSKQRDFSITQEVLRAFGDAIKDQIRRVLRSINQAREDGLAIGVTGMDEFDIADFGTEVDDAARLLEMGVHSETLKKEVFKKLSLKLLADVRQDVKDRIVMEIEQGQ